MRAALALAVLVCACSAPPPAPVRAAQRRPESPPPKAQVVVDVEGAVVIGREAPGAPEWRVATRLFPALDPSWKRSPDRVVAAGADGTVLAGASDGSLLALDAKGTPLWQLGVRGAVVALDAETNGTFTVRTAAGVLVEIGPGGAIRRETQFPAQPPENAAPVRSPAVPWTATAAYRARRVAGFRNVRSVLAVGPDDVWILATDERTRPGSNPPLHLFHHDGRGWSDLGVPRAPFKREVFAEGHPAAAGTFVPASLARGPSGALLVIGGRVDRAKRMCVLELAGAAFRERREAFAIVARIKTNRDQEHDITYAAAPSGREVLCNVGDRDGQHPTAACVEFGVGRAPRLLGADEGRTMPDGFDRLPGYRWDYFLPIAFGGETLWRTNGWARSVDDVGGFAGSTITRWNGSSLERVESPVASIASAWSSGRSDVWITGVGGVARFDGARWWRILAARETYRDELVVTGSGPADVWLHGPGGLWHVTPEAGAEPDVEGAAAGAPPAAAPSRPLPVASKDRSYHLERATVDVPGGEPLRIGLGVAAGPGGAIWLWDGARVVELDGERARVVHASPKPVPFVCWSAPVPDCEVCAACTEPSPAPLGCTRCAAPAGTGEGAVLTPEGLVAIAGGRAADDGRPPWAATAVAAAPSGAIWAVSAQEDDELPHAVVHGSHGLRLVKGLPPAAYADVAARADDDVWLTGGLTTVADGDLVWPSGEGTLVHFDGRGFARHRGPDGALLSVAAAGQGEAWAVGAGGGVLHVKDGIAAAFHVEREGGGRLGVTLRGVAAGPTGVWLVGEGSTVLRWNGEGLARIDASAAGRAATLTGVLAPGDRPGWVVGPSGIWRVVRTR